MQIITIFHFFEKGLPLIDFKGCKRNLIFSKCQTTHTNIGLTTLVGTWLKSCICLSFDLFRWQF
jgi:hypothetical protein